MDTATLFARLDTYYGMLVGEHGTDAGDWATLISMERLTQSALQSIAPELLARFPEKVQDQYRVVMGLLRQIPESHTLWDERKDLMLECRLLLKRLLS